MSFFNRIKFYRTRDEYGAFSNFAKYPLEINGKTYATSEHLYQSLKFTDPEAQEIIRTASSAKMAAHLGRGLPGMRADWNEVRADVMYEVLKHKYAQHEELKQLLLSTGDAEIVEHSINDSYWADGGDGTGQNMLGVLLMRLRDELNCPNNYTDLQHTSCSLCGIGGVWVNDIAQENTNVPVAQLDRASTS